MNLIFLFHVHKKKLKVLKHYIKSSFMDLKKLKNTEYFMPSLIILVTTCRLLLLSIFYMKWESKMIKSST